MKEYALSGNVTGAFESWVLDTLREAKYITVILGIPK